MKLHHQKTKAGKRLFGWATIRPKFQEVTIRPKRQFVPF